MRFLRKLFSSSATPVSQPQSRRSPVMVVGMHRSGTSFLTGSLQQAGLELGKFSEWNPHNLKGNRENQDIVEFHDRVLAARSRSWDNPPEGRIEWTQTERNQAVELISSFREVPHWGFKDPRSLLMVEEWQKLLPNLSFVGIFRHPTAVVQSLHARGGMPEEQALKLWQSYNQRLLALHSHQRFPLLCFDEDEAGLHLKLNRILRDLGLKSLAEDRFFSAELKHHSQQAATLPDELSKLYRELCARAR